MWRVSWLAEELSVLKHRISWGKYDWEDSLFCVGWVVLDVPEPLHSFETSGTIFPTTASYPEGRECSDVNNKYPDMKAYYYFIISWVVILIRAEHVAHLNSTVLWDLLPCSLVETNYISVQRAASTFSVKGFFCLDIGSSRFHWRMGKFLQGSLLS
jgi:hypothetical protein